MVRLQGRQRMLFAEKLSDVANLAVGALLFGQFLGERAFSPLVALGGLLAWASFTAYALYLAREDRG